MIMNARSAQTATSHDTLPRPRRRHNRRLIVAGVLACLTVAILMMLWNMFDTPESLATRPLTLRSSSRSEVASTAARNGSTDANPPVDLVDDDGQTLWMSATDGRPVDL